MQDRDAAFSFEEVRAHFFRMRSITLKLVLKERKQTIIRADEFLAIARRDPPQIADDPALRLEFPLVGQPHKTKIRADIREERELPATQGAEIPLTALRAEASQQGHVRRRFRPQPGPLPRGGGILTLVAAPLVPQVRVGLQVSPLALIGRGHGVTDVAAERLSAGVVRCALLSAIQLRNGRIKSIIQLANFLRVQFVDVSKNLHVQIVSNLP